MIELTQEELKQHFSEPIFGQIAETADALGLECYVVGGYVRDIFLQRPSKDIDVVVVGSGIAMAEALGKHLGRGAHVSVFKNFGTAQVNIKVRKWNLWGRAESPTNGILASRLWRTGRWKTIRTVVTSQLMPSPSASIRDASVNW